MTSPIRPLVARVGQTLESAGTVCALFVLSGALFMVMGSGDSPTELGSPTAISRAISWGMYFFVVLQAALRPRALLRTALRNPFIPAFVLVAFLSIAWSDDHVSSLKGATALCLWTLFGLYLEARYTTQSLLRHLAVALGATAVLSLVFALVAPAYGISQGSTDQDWRGVFIQKQQLGFTMLLACVVFVLLARAQRGWTRAVAWLFVLLAIILLVLSRSRTALLVLVAVAVIVPAIVALGRGGRSALVALCVLLAGATVTVVAVTQRELVLNELGKDPTLTGRTPLWAAVADRIGKRPLLGYGYRAFWAPESEFAEEVRATIGWDTPHSHNAFMDFWLDLGLLGVVILLAGFVVAIRRALAAVRAPPTLERKWAMTILIVTIPVNMVSSQIYENRLAWVLFVAVGVCATLRASSDGQPSSSREVRPYGARPA